MAVREACFMHRDHRDLHGPTFFKLLPPSRFASPPEKTALQVLQAKQILQGKKLLQAGIREEAGRQAAMGTAKAIEEQRQKLPLEADNSQQLRHSTTGAPQRMGNSAVEVSFGQQMLQQRSDQKRTRSGGTEMHPNVQAHIKPLKKGSVQTLQDREDRGNGAEQNCCSKGTAEGPFEEKVFLLSTGKLVSIPVDPTLTKAKPVTVPPNKPSTPASGKDAQGTAVVEGLKYDNYYSCAASGLCAVATTKRAWEYQEEPGQRRLELCLKDQFNKYPKKLEFYNSIGAENRPRGNANAGGEKSLSPQTGSKKHRNDLHHQDLGRRVTGTTIAMLHTSHQGTSAARGGSTIQGPPLPNSDTSSRGQRLAANSEAARATPTVELEAIHGAPLPSPANEYRGDATPTVIKGGRKMEIGVASGERVTEGNHLLPKSSNLNLEEGCRHGMTPERPLVASSSGGPPQIYPLAIANGGGSGVSSTLETVTPKPEAGIDMTMASTASPPVVQEPVNDLDVEDVASVPATGSTVVATDTLSTAGVVCVTTVNQIEIKGVAERREDTRNDTAIAQVLQFEENEQAGLPHSSSHASGTRGDSGSPTSSEDYRMARQMQQEYDAEMAFLVQQEEERQSRARTYNSPFDERADRRNMPSTYSSPPVDNNANSRYHNRVHGRLGYCDVATYDQHPGDEEEEEEEEEEAGRYMWTPGLGMVVATRRDPPQVHAHGHVHGEMDMSYEALSQLKDVSRGLSRATISRMTNTYKHEPKRDGTDRSGDETTSKCCICLQEFEAGQELRSLPCIHAFHRHCIDKWLTENKHCPVCMKNILDFARQFV